jgi:hypothetical protein
LAIPVPSGTGAGKPNWEEVEHVMAAFLELHEQQRPAYLARQPA